MKAIQYVAQIKKAFNTAGDAQTAIAQSKYLRDLFPFFGLKKPERNLIQKTFFEKNGLPDDADLVNVIRLCFKESKREMQYFALDILTRRIKKQDETFVALLEELIQTKSWWDSVDFLSSICGKYFLKHNQLIPEATDRWIESEDFWLNRVAIIFQLHHKDKTDEPLLYRYVLRHIESEEFFIQKASGWALRQHSKRLPESVIAFVRNHPLAPLTAREALKHLKKTNPDRLSY